MSTFIDIAIYVLSCLPKFFNWWLYKPSRTTQHIDFHVSANESTVEIWCDKIQSNFSLWVEVKNNNPFPIEIDRAEASGYLNNARLKALNLIGIQLKKGESKSLHLEGRIDEASLEQVRCSPENAPLQVIIRCIIKNKYHTIRNFSISFDRLMCRLVNKHV
jgi:hypothetical protein